MSGLRADDSVHFDSARGGYFWLSADACGAAFVTPNACTPLELPGSSVSDCGKTPARAGKPAQRHVVKQKLATSVPGPWSLPARGSLR